MEEEWRLFLKDNAPELYEKMRDSVSWAAEWRDNKIEALTAERDDLFRKWSASQSVREQDLEANNQRLVGLFKKIKEDGWCEDYGMSGLMDIVDEALKKGEVD